MIVAQLHQTRHLYATDNRGCGYATELLHMMLRWPAGDNLFSFSYNGATARSPYRHQQRASDAAGRSLNDSWAFYKSFAPPDSLAAHTLFITPTKSVFTIDGRTSQVGQAAALSRATCTAASAPALLPAGGSTCACPLLSARLLSQVISQECRRKLQGRGSGQMHVYPQCEP